MENTRPTVLADGEILDTLTVWNIATVTSRQLREGMILVDGDGFSCAILDHLCASRSTGSATWLVEDADSGRYSQVSLSTTRTPTIKVAAGENVG